MPKKLEEITVDEVNNYYICTICKLFYTIQETTSCDFKTLCKCINCTAIEREKSILNENELLKQVRNDRLSEMKKYLDENPITPDK